MNVITRPRAVARVFANATDPKTMLSNLVSAFDDFKKVQAGRVGNLEVNTQKAIDDLSAKIAAMTSGGGAVAGELPEDPEYSRLFASFFRTGTGDDMLRVANADGERARIHASMSNGSNGDGGYLSPIEWDRRILKKLTTVSPMRRLATVVTTSVRGYSTLWNTAAWGSGWVGETTTRTNTSSATLAPVVFDSGEIYANVAATQQLLDDAAINLEEWISNEVTDEFDKQEGIAFLSGDGVNKPRGLLTYVTGGASETTHPGGVLSSTVSGSAASITGDGLIALVYAVGARYRQNATWLMSNATLSEVRKLKDGQGNYLWQPSYIVGQPSTLLGFPVETDEGMPNVAANAFPIAFGDFRRGYLINDRIGTRLLRDPYTMKPYVQFYITRRVGGGVQDPNAIKLMKIST